MRVGGCCLRSFARKEVVNQRLSGHEDMPLGGDSEHVSPSLPPRNIPGNRFRTGVVYFPFPIQPCEFRLTGILEAPLAHRKWQAHFMLPRGGRHILRGAHINCSKKNVWVTNSGGFPPHNS
jgi:hypothetical protein